MEDSDMIDRYLRGELNKEQSETFSKQLQSNSDLQKKVALRKLVIAGISQAYAEELKQKLSDFDHSLENKKRFQFSWKMAAAFAIILTAASIVYLSIQKPNPYDYDMVEIGLPNMMGAAYEIELNNAMSIFKSADYIRSGKAFDDLLINHPKNDTLLYFSALCDFRNRNIRTAINKWSQIEASSPFINKTEYRLAIAYWVYGDKSRAVEILQKIASNKNDSLSKQARTALEALN